MTISNNFFLRRGAQLLRLASVLILAGCALWLVLRVPVNHARAVTPANPLPDLRGREAVDHLKQEGLYDTLAEAVAAARYNADTMPSVDAYQFSNPVQGLRATFTSSGARFVSSKGGRYRELATKLIGYGYGSRMTALDSRNIVARRNRIEHEYSVKESATRDPQSGSGSSTARRALNMDSRCLNRRQPTEAMVRRCEWRWKSAETSNRDSMRGGRR